MQTVKSTALAIWVALVSVSALAADRIEGRVEAGSAPISGADVTLWLAGPGAPQKLAEANTTDDGSYDLAFAEGRDDAGVRKLREAIGPAQSITTVANLTDASDCRTVRPGLSQLLLVAGRAEVRVWTN